MHEHSHASSQIKRQSQVAQLPTEQLLAAEVNRVADDEPLWKRLGQATMAMVRVAFTGRYD